MFCVCTVDALDKKIEELRTNDSCRGWVAAIAVVPRIRLKDGSYVSKGLINKYNIQQCKHNLDMVGWMKGPFGITNIFENNSLLLLSGHEMWTNILLMYIVSTLPVRVWLICCLQNKLQLTYLQYMFFSIENILPCLYLYAHNYFSKNVI